MAFPLLSISFRYISLINNKLLYLIQTSSFLAKHAATYSAATTSVDGGGLAAANFSSFSGEVAISCKKINAINE